MSRISVLGGCGAIGSMAVRTLASGDCFQEIVIADKEIDAARRLAREWGPERVSAVRVDAEEPGSIRAVIEGSSVVLNCIGPYYKFGPPILRAVIESGIDYVDVCDDLDATEKMLAMDEEAKSRGLSALIGMGSSPGMANVFVRLCAEEMLSEVEAVNIYHAHGGEPVEGAAVVKHRMHAMESEIPVFMNGEFTTVRMLEESGKALVEETEFKDLGTYPVYPYPHPETITLPKHITGVKQVTNLGVVLPLEYFNLTMGMVELGLSSDEPLIVQDHEIIPREFTVTFVLSRREELMRAAGITGPLGCLKVVVRGRKNGAPHTYIFSMSSREEGAGEGTGIPAALGAILMSQGKITERGVFPPEAGVNPQDMLTLANEVIKSVGMGDKVPLSIDHIDSEGNKESWDLRL